MGNENDWWTTEKDYLGPNTQVGLAQMGQAVDPEGPGGRVGTMFSQYLQGLQAQKAFGEQMQQRKDLYDMFTRMLGLKPETSVGPYETEPRGYQGPPEVVNKYDPLSSENWLSSLGR